MDWNEIPKTLPQEEWKRIEDLVMVEKYIIERNRWYLNQTHGTSCAIEPLQSLLGLENRTIFGNSVLERTIDLSQLPLYQAPTTLLHRNEKTEKPLIERVHNK